MTTVYEAQHLRTHFTIELHAAMTVLKIPFSQDNSALALALRRKTILVIRMT